MLATKTAFASPAIPQTAEKAGNSTEQKVEQVARIAADPAAEPKDERVDPVAVDPTLEPDEQVDPQQRQVILQESQALEAEVDP